MSIFDILSTYKTALLEGLQVTFQLCLIVWVTGLISGTILGSMGARWPAYVGIPSRAMSYALSAMPVLVFLFWLHYPMQSMLNVMIDPFVTAALTLSILNTFAIADIVRNVLRDFPQQYIAAARVCGLNSSQTLMHVQLPIVFRQCIPQLLTQQVNMLQATLFASLISVNEIFRVAQRINSTIYKPVEVYTALGLLFLTVCLPLNGLALWLKGRFTRDFSEA